MSRLTLQITDLGSGIMVQGNDNHFFPDNATLTFPYNSIIVVTDESDMVTFRSASNNDVLFSALISSIEIDGESVTKENINIKFDAIANQSSGGGGDITGLFASVSYDSDTKHINFYDTDRTLVDYVDATNFIKDGMVSNVEISNGNLVITFNTDAGKEPITIPLTDIFNPNNYYDKTQSDSLFASQTVVNQEIAARIQGDSDLNTALGAKADKSDTYTKSQVDALIPDTSNFVTKAEYNPKELATAKALTQLNDTKADKTELPDTSTFATKTELNAKQDTLTAGQNITIQNNVISATGGGGASYQFYSETDEEQEEGTTINRHKDGVIQIADEGGTINSGMGTFFTQVEEDGSISYTQVNSSMYADKDDGETVNGATIAVNYNNISITVTEDGEDNGTQYSKNTDFIVNPDSLTVEVSVDGVTATQLELNDSGLSINGDNVLTESDGAYYISFATLATVGIHDEDWDGIVAAIDDHRPIYAGYPRTDGGILYYGVECMNKNVSNTQIVLTSSDDNSHYFYTFTKNGSNDYSYTVETRPYTTAAEKTAWNAKVNNLGGVTNIVKISSADYEALATKDNNTLYVITTN